MTTIGIVFLAVAIVVILVLAAFWIVQKRSRRLKSRYGSEYVRAVNEAGNTRKGEARLRNAEKRVQRFHIRPLSPGEKERFAITWQSVQRRFVDDPAASLAEADDLVHEVMTARGYPMEDFEQSAVDVAVDHPAVVDHYRAGHAVCLRQTTGKVTTEELRRAMVDYRALFDDLLGDGEILMQRRAS